jgi:acyl-[acyl-carrier-protein] desaturase
VTEPTRNPDGWTDVDLIRDLQPVVETELNRHLSTARDWMPHEYVPWSDGRTFDGPLNGEAWNIEQSQIASDAARTALVVNLLTEDNLPSYHSEIAAIFGADGAWGTWVHRWTAEEGRHAAVMRDYLLVTRAVDPVELEEQRMEHMSTGYKNSHSDKLLHGVAYVSFQELATRVSHRNTGVVSGDPICDQLMQRIALDENLHMLFYRNVMAGALEVSPTASMEAITDVVKNFQMPGAGIEGFGRKSVEIAIAGIYGLKQHLDEVIRPVLRQWGIFEMEGLDAPAEKARTELAEFLDTLSVEAARFEERREQILARRAARG